MPKTSVCESCDQEFEGDRKYCTPRCRKELECRAKGLTAFRHSVAAIFQQMVRAEAGADPRQFVTAVVNGKIRQVERRIGQCVCVTCGKIHNWSSGLEGMHTGHFLASRRPSILLDEANVAPQCSHCNRYESGRQNEFRMWMEMVRPKDIERLERLKTQSVTFTRDELVDRWFEFSERLKAAKERMRR